MNNSEKQEAQKSLAKTRDNLQQIMSEARGQRTELRLSNREKYNDFLQKLGELSFLFGAAVVPLVIVSHTSANLNHITFVFAGVSIYLINGFLALWKTKHRIEQDADDLPFIGLDEEIATYPVINAINKLQLEIENKEYQKEYLDATNNDIFKSGGAPENKIQVSFWLDIILLNFVLASLLIMRAAWPYSAVIYWVGFVLIVLLLVCLVVVSYIQTTRRQSNLQEKRKDLNKIRSDYSKWFDDTVLRRT